MRVEHRYHGTKELAYEKLSDFLTQLQEQYKREISNASSSWNEARNKMDFSFEARGFTLSGNIVLQDGIVILEGKVPFLARPFQGKAEKMIKKKLEEIL